LKYFYHPDKPTSIKIDSTVVQPASSFCCDYGYCSCSGLFNWINNCRKDLLLTTITLLPHEQHYGVVYAYNNITLYGSGTKVFGNKMDNVFLDPNNITPKEVAFLLQQILQHKRPEEDHLAYLQTFGTLDAHSASGPSIIALNDFLEKLGYNETNDDKKNDLTYFFAEEVANALSTPDRPYDVATVQQLFGELARLTSKVICINPPGIFFNAEFRSKYFLSLETQSYAVGDAPDKIVTETYFTTMIEKFLQKTLPILPLEGILHNTDCSAINSKYTTFREFRYNFQGMQRVVSSVTDETVFPFYYVAKFAEQLRDKTRLDNKTISKLVYQIMQYGDLENVEEDVNKA